MEKPLKMSSAVLNKRKRKAKSKLTASEPKNMKLDAQEKTTDVQNQKDEQKVELPNVTYKEPSLKDIGERYPVLNNEELVKKFLSVPMNNNQKGRIRQILKDNLKGTSELLLPDVIHNRIQTILKSAVNLTDTDLRKLRILYNMLKTATQTDKTVKNKDKKEPEKKTKDLKNKKDNDKNKEVKKDTVKDTEKKDAKVRGPKRYVVFVGNLPLNIDKEKIMHHFSELGDYIKDIRIPKQAEGKKSAIAYIELEDEPSYELALSKHHSMLGAKRINVLYTTQKKGKVTKTEAKGKAAKLIALQKSGKLLGSIPLNRKRSQRRKKMKQALAKQTVES